jgi:hypothetical protein
MPMAKVKPRRIRPRTGYVQVELTAEERGALEAIRDRRAAETGERTSLAGTLRWLLNREGRR